jgi:hypothetical protein
VDELMLNCPPAFVDFDLLEKDSFPHEDGVAIYHWAAAK